MPSPPVHRRARLLPIAAGFAVPLAAAVAFLLAPGRLDDKLFLALRGVCAQRPAHSVIVDGQPLALEARMLGIFLGFALATLVPWLRGAWRRSELPRGGVAIACMLCLIVLGLDGLNATLYDLQAPHLYAPRTELRLLSGLLGGLGFAAFAAPVISFVFWKVREPLPLYRSWSDLLVSLAVVLGAGVLVLLGVGGPVLLSIAALGAVVGSFWLVSTYLAVLAWNGPGQATAWRDLAGVGAAGFVLVVVELFALAAIRTWMETSLGIPWAV